MRYTRLSSARRGMHHESQPHLRHACGDWTIFTSVVTKQQRQSRAKVLTSWVIFPFGLGAKVFVVGLTNDALTSRFESFIRTAVTSQPNASFSDLNAPPACWDDPSPVMLPRHSTNVSLAPYTMSHRIKCLRSGAPPLSASHRAQASTALRSGPRPHLRVVSLPPSGGLPASTLSKLRPASLPDSYHGV